MKNRDVYLKNPTERKLANEGVANVNDETTPEALGVLRWELETFVCDGQYGNGMRHIIETFLRNVNEAQQPAVWVSGFYGSGKSHLAKMLRTLWVNAPFEDSVRPRELANLPDDVHRLFADLDARSELYGGRHAASGTLGAAASGSVRLALLRIIFRSLGLPERYQAASFAMWLKKEGIYDDARNFVLRDTLDWQYELDNFYVSDAICGALANLRPRQFTADSCAEILKNAYKNVDDVSSSEMTGAIRDALRFFSYGGTASNLSKPPKSDFPLTLVALDEVQQYIGSDANRSLAIQEAVEACCRDFGGKLMFLGTGQTSITGTANLKKLEGRFTVRIQLSDSDVDAVIRGVILAKKPEAERPIKKIMDENIGEISRHLSGSSIGHDDRDVRHFVADYPLLPIRRRFWESALKALDRTGTDSQLRNQLSMMHNAITTNLDEPIGYVLPADYIYFYLADKMLQAHILPRRLHERTASWITGSDDERLMARTCAIVFLINKLSESNPEMGVKATPELIADLLVEYLPDGSLSLRASLPDALDKCVAEKMLMRIGDGFRVQTEESVTWSDEFEARRAEFSNEPHRMEAELDDRVRSKLVKVLGTTGGNLLSTQQGRRKLSRFARVVFDSPPHDDSGIYVLVRDGWRTEEESLAEEARRAGNKSPTIFVFIPKTQDELRLHLIDSMAAAAALEKMGRPTAREGIEARSSVETLQTVANARIDELLEKAIKGATVFQGGGIEVKIGGLKESIIEAAHNSSLRLYTKYDDADHENWGKACESAQKGASDALKLVDYNEDAIKHPICRAVYDFVSGGVSGADIRSRFDAPPYGWPRDAVDAAIFVLMSANMIRAAENGRPLAPGTLSRNAIGRTLFKVESVVLSTTQRIAVRKLIQSIEIQTGQEDDLAMAPIFLKKLVSMAKDAGGDAPLPPRPSTALVDEISDLSGNELIMTLYKNREELLGYVKDWHERAEMIKSRMPKWSTAEKLLEAARGLPGADDAKSRMSNIEIERRLLDDPNPLPHVVDDLSKTLANELRRLDEEYETRHAGGVERLKNDERWEAIDRERRAEILRFLKLNSTSKPAVETGCPADILNTLKNCSLVSFSDRIAAMPARFDEALSMASKDLEPKAREISIAKRSFRTEEEIDAWSDEARATLKAALRDGPVYIR